MTEFGPELEAVAPGVRRLRLPIPFPMRWVNVYVLGDGATPTLVDAGYPVPEARSLLLEALHRAGLRPEILLVTHAHPDHFGLAAELAGELGCEVWMESRELEAAQSYQPASSTWGLLAAQFEQGGMPPDRVEDVIRTGQHTWAVTPPPRVSRFVRADEELELGGRRWRVLVTPGHAPAHVCLFDPDSQTLLAGDHLLPRITPNIGLWPTGSEDPLDDFLRSLAALRPLPVRRVLPGHGDPYDTFQGRVQELLDHHRQRLQAILQTLRGGPRTAYGVCTALFGDGLDSHNVRFAMVETLSHLAYLERRGRLQRGEDGLYRASH
ncbi:MAG: MBL fold metallo-hydrolase [Armatimonadota bacterium]|nr:MBL fold metallo-hydrolase [Armatimonadota bacterium]MDW8155482.1 MBL fold metallo-hydrolase [Armatimonadota bacterium]